MIEINFDFETKEEYDLFVLLTMPTIKKHLRGRVFASTLRAGKTVNLKIIPREVSNGNKLSQKNCNK